MMKKLITLFVAIVATCSLWASNVITYSASEKLTEVTSTSNYGLHTKAFNVSITSHTFSDGMGTIIFSGEVTSIREGAFYGCSGLTSITIPGSVTSIGEEAFYRCSGLNEVHITDLAAWCRISVAGGAANPLVYAQRLFLNDEEVTNLVIPNSVTSIGAGAFYGCSSLTSVTIPNTVTSIGERAFGFCTGLTSVTIPNSVTSIGDDAFYGCSGLTSVTIPNSVTSIGDDAFGYCSGLTSVTIPNSVTSIGRSAFYECSGLTSVIIGNSVTSIGVGAFYGCSGLTSVTIPNSVTSIGDNAFYEVRYVVYNGSAMGAPWGANCVNGFVDGYLIYNNTDKTKLIACSPAAVGDITIPESVTSIGFNAFQGCSELTSITIPESITSIGIHAFKGCTSITSVTWNAKNCEPTSYSYRDDSNDYSYSCPGPFYEIKGQITSFTFGENVESIPSYLCYGMSNLPSVTIPESVTSIGEEAFVFCTGLTSVTIPESVTNIGIVAFYGCTSLTSVTWNARNCEATYDYDPWSRDFYYFGPFNGIQNIITSFTFGENVESIPSYLCYGMSNLPSVTIPESVTSIGSEAFYGCTSLTAVTWNAIDCEASYSSDDYSAYYGPFSEIRNQITNFTFGENVESIPTHLCYDMSNLTTIAIPESVTSIGEGAFDGCSGLNEVHITDVAAWCGISFERSNANPLSYAHHLYLNGEEVMNLVIPNSVTSINNYAFYGGSNITSVTIPESVTSIGSGVFYGCTSLTAVTWNATNCASCTTFYGMSQITNFTFGENVVNIPDDLCRGMRNLTSIAIPESVTSIGRGAFDGCSGLNEVHITDLAAWCGISFDGSDANPLSYAQHLYLNGEEVMNLVIPNSVTSINNYAFHGGSSITSVTIPNSVTSIGSGAFYGCENIADIYCYAQVPPTANGSTFGMVSQHCYIHIPAGTIRQYQMAPGWSQFLHYFEISELPEGTPTDKVGVTVVENYATFTWPVNPTASSYTLTITKDGEVFCTLIFNSLGQLVGMAFAPARDSKANAPANAEPTAYGYAFVVRGLEQGVYEYTFTANDSEDNVIETFTGSFSTEEVTALDNIVAPLQQSQKLLRNGQLLILRDGKFYNMQGAEVR